MKSKTEGGLSINVYQAQNINNGVDVNSVTLSAHDGFLRVGFFTGDIRGHRVEIIISAKELASWWPELLK